MQVTDITVWIAWVLIFMYIFSVNFTSNQSNSKTLLDTIINLTILYTYLK